LSGWFCIKKQKQIRNAIERGEEKRKRKEERMQRRREEGSVVILIWCLFDLWIRDPGWVKNLDLDPG
jgi:hypothetical protein